MATLKNKRKLADTKRENYEEHPRNSCARERNHPRRQENYITRASDEIEGRVTKILSQEFNRTENSILDVLSKIDEFFGLTSSSSIQNRRRDILERVQGNRVPNEVDSQNNSHPENISEPILSWLLPR